MAADENDRIRHRIIKYPLLFFKIKRPFVFVLNKNVLTCTSIVFDVKKG